MFRVLETGIGIAAKHGCRMLSSPPAVRHVDNGRVESPKDAQDGRQRLHFADRPRNRRSSR